MLNRLSRLYLIRHGQTAWSLSGQHAGRTEIPLTEHGEQDARELAERLRVVRFSHVFTSARQRAQRTCELVGLDAVAELEPDLTEWDYGDYEGQRSVDIRKERPDWNLFQDGCPRGESPVQVSERADWAMARLRALEGNMAIFSHGHFGRVLAARWIGLPVGQAQHFLLSTASLSILGYEHNLAAESAIVLWNTLSIDRFDLVPSPVLNVTKPPQGIREAGRLPYVIHGNVGSGLGLFDLDDLHGEPQREEVSRRDSRHPVSHAASPNSGHSARSQEVCDHRGVPDLFRLQQISTVSQSRGSPRHLC